MLVGFYDSQDLSYQLRLVSEQSVSEQCVSEQYVMNPLRRCLCQ